MFSALTRCRLKRRRSIRRVCAPYVLRTWCSRYFTKWTSSFSRTSCKVRILIACAFFWVELGEDERDKWAKMINSVIINLLCLLEIYYKENFHYKLVLIYIGINYIKTYITNWHYLFIIIIIIEDNLCKWNESFFFSSWT